MRSALSVAIATLLVASLLPMAIVTAAPTPDPALPGDSSTAQSPETDTVASQAAFQADPDDTTTRLGLGGQGEAGYAATGPDLGTTLAASDDELRQEWRFQELQYEWEALSYAEREERVVAYTDWLIDRADQLDERERAAVRAMAAGDASPSRVLRSIARSDREAEIMLSNLDRLSRTARTIPDLTSITRPTRGAVETQEGPVRDTTYQAMSASGTEGASGLVLIEATDSGAIVSSVSGASYAREANRYDNRDLSQPNQLSDMSEGIDRLEALYPWAQGPDADGSNSHDQFLSLHQYTFETHHAQGLLRVHLDSGTTDVFREVQELGIGDLPVESGGTWNGEATTVSLNVTPRNGPIQFNVTDTSGQPVPATILVDGQPIAETGPDGTAWVVRPMDGAEFTVQTDAESITVDPDG